MSFFSGLFKGIRTYKADVVGNVGESSTGGTSARKISIRKLAEDMAAKRALSANAPNAAAPVASAPAEAVAEASEPTAVPTVEATNVEAPPAADPPLGNTQPASTSAQAHTPSQMMNGLLRNTYAAAASQQAQAQAHIANNAERAQNEIQSALSNAQQAQERAQNQMKSAFGNIFNFNPTASLHPNRPRQHAWKSWNPKYGYDRSAWARQGYSDALYSTMLNTLNRIREMGFEESQFSEGKILDLIHGRIKTISGGNFGKDLDDKEKNELMFKVIADIIDGPDSDSTARNSNGRMPGEW